MKKLIIVTMVFTFIITSESFAEIPESPGRDLGIEVGFETSYINYEEPDVMEEEGLMYGVVGSYTFRNSRNNYMLRAEGRFSFGEVDYTSVSTGSMNNVEDYILELRGVVGYDFPVLEATTLTPYIGIGYRYLNDDSSGMTTTTGHVGYKRESNYYYTPLGIETMTALDNGWSIGLTLEYDHFWKGIQKSHLSDANLGFNDVENDQNEGYGCRASIKFQKKSERFDYVIEPFIRYWEIKKSEISAVTYSGVIIGYGYEPENTSLEYGLKIAAKF